VDEFLAAVRDLSPTAEKKLAELITTKGTDMNLEQALAEISKLNGELEATKAKLTVAEQAALDAKEAEGKAKKALAEATDEVLKVGETEIKKSAVGDGNFAIFKAQEDRAQTAEFEKRASTDFGHVVGTPSEKALVLKARAGMTEAGQTALDAILTSAEKMAAAGFGRLGGRDGGDPSSDVGKAIATYKGKIADIVKRDNVAEHVAMSKAREEFPAEFAAAYPQQAAN
jgi:hypothetical protein